MPAPIALHMPAPVLQHKRYVALRAHFELGSRSRFIGAVLGVEDDSGLVVPARLPGVLGTVAVDASFEAAELAGEDSAVGLAVVGLQAVGEALGAAVLAEVAGVGLEF